jgi:hypothetical protein
MKKILLTLLTFTLINVLTAQQKNYWFQHLTKENIVTDKAVSRLSFPTEFKLYDLNIEPLRQQLFSIVDNRANAHSTIISLPNADGNMEQFEVFEASNFEPALQARFPEIRAFSGKGVSDKYAMLKLSISPQGIQTMVFRTDKENEFIEAYSQDHSVYAVFKSQRKAGTLPWTCSTVDENVARSLNNQVQYSNITARSGADLKTMRLAQSCNAEYSNYFGATSSAQVGLVLAAFNATLTRCNGVYEKDLALHLNLIANTTSVIYYTASTDPYTTTLSSWNSQLQSTLTSVIGEANYDIGHMFGSTGGGGNAGCIGCVCNTGKGSGITSPADGIPQGDNFDIDYVVHEVGHQLGANHTFSMSNEGTGVNKEVGSGVTIMGYAGITSQDVANHSYDVYHQASIAQIQANLATKTCPVTTSIASTNATPVIATLSNYTIPRSTPFALTGSATDANGDALTYSWEQNDNASSTQTGASSVASATKATGPNWVTFRPSASPTRFFPQLSTILAGGLTSGPLTGGDAGTTTEALSSVARTLNFRLTVRDNAPYVSTTPVKVGQTEFRDMVVTVNAASGPFAVSVPNTAVTYAGGSTQTITWSVASTTAAPVSCANVKISLSTDGGQTFPTVLIASTPNDGTEALLIPNTPTTTARIKVEAVGNIFFDISNANFTISGAAACGDPTGLTTTAIGDNVATLNWTAVTNALSYAVDYKLNTATTWTSLSTAQTTTTANLTGLTQGTSYNWRVRATCSAGSGNYVTANFTTTAPFVCNAPTGLTATSITSTGATLNWAAVTGASTYAVDYKLSSSATWISVTASTTSTSASVTGLTASNIYDYRVSTNCGVNGASGFASAQFTSAAPFVCNAPTGLTATSITSTSATLNWAAVTGASTYAVDYKLSTSTSWISVTASTTSTSASVTGLTASSIYDYRVSTNCGVNGASGFASAQFTSASACAASFEPNETTATAATIASGVTNTAAISTATDIDYFKITTTGVSNIVYNLVGPAGVDFDLTITNSAGTQVGSAATTSSTETVSLTNQAAGTYFIKVFGFSGAFSATCYTIKATATAVTSCRSSKDTSTNNTTTGAAVIPFNTNITGQIEAASDVDHYKFTITTAGTITLTLTTLPINYNLRLVSSTGTVLVTSQNNNTTNETINYTAASGIYYARVYAPNTAFNATSCYTLRVALGTATKAENIGLNNGNNVTIYPNPAQRLLNIDLSGFKGATEIRLFDINGRQVINQKANLTNNQLNVSKLYKGIYLVKVLDRNSNVMVTKKFIKE